MAKRSFGRRLLFYLSSPKCVSCGQPLEIDEYAFCRDCRERFNNELDRSCSLCSRPLFECDCPTEFLSAHFVKKLYKSFRYRGRGNDNVKAALIYNLKRSSRWDTVQFALDLLERSLRTSGENFTDYVFTNIPRRRNAVIEYGVDQSALLAKGIAKRLGARYKPLLKSKSRNQQKSLSREERMKNAKFSLKGSKRFYAKKVIIVDDIVTTGATMGTAASLIRSLGVKEIRGLALGIAYPDNS